MKFRRRPAPLLLLLLPSLATALAVGAQDNQATLSKNTEPREARIDPIPTPAVDLNTKSRFEIGTKDAPVDGKDGKPHAGPFVGDNDIKKPKVEKVEEKVLKEDKTVLVTPTGEKIPQVNDGVMDDPNRLPPKLGTTGTGGGVSEKDKVRKAQEGQTGEKLEKKPDSPKEAPPLPHSEQIKVDGEKIKTSIDKDDEDGEGLAGIEVSPELHFKSSRTDFRRNQMIYQASQTTSLILYQTPPTRTTLISLSQTRKPSSRSIWWTNPRMGLSSLFIHTSCLSP